MGYPNIGKVKTIFLPMKDLPYGSTLDEYKNLYGIDLKQWVRVENNQSIILDLPENSLVLIQSGFGGMHTSIACPILEVGYTNYVEGDEDATLVLYTNIGKTEGFIFFIESDKPCTLENVVVANFNQY